MIVKLSIAMFALLATVAGVAAIASVPFVVVGGAVIIVEVLVAGNLAIGAILRHERRKAIRRQPERSCDPDNRIVVYRVVGEIIDEQSQSQAQRRRREIAPAEPLALPAPTITQEVSR